MKVSKYKLKKIIQKEVQNLLEIGELPPPVEPLEEPAISSGPWEAKYEEYTDLADEALEAYREGTLHHFVKNLSPEEHAGAYHYLQTIGGMDPMKGIEPDDPEYISWRDRPLRNPEAVSTAIALRLMMDLFPGRHHIRRTMSEPPAPTRGKPLHVRHGEEEGEESSILKKYGPEYKKRAYFGVKEVNLKATLQNLVQEELESLFSKKSS